MARTDVAFSKILVGFEGYVSVGSTLNSRKKLYARLEDDALVFYKNPPLKTPKGNISLADVKRLTGALPVGFPVPPATLSSSAWFAMEGGNRTYVFNAGTASARDQWIGELKDIITASSDLEPGEDVLLCGDLIKCDGKGKSWKHRSFVVSFSSRSMMYFEKAMEVSNRIILSPQPNDENVTVFPLSENSSSVDFSFYLISQGRKLIISASDSREYTGWLQAITAATQPSSEPRRAIHASSPSLDLVLGSGNFFEMVNIARSSACLREGVMKKKNKMKMWSPRYYVLQHVVERGSQDVLLTDATTKAEYVRGLYKNSSSCRSLVSAAFHTSKSGKATKGGCRIDLTFDDEVLPLRCADFSEAKEWIDQFNLAILMCEGMREPTAPTQELPPSHPLYMRPEKKDSEKDTHSSGGSSSNSGNNDGDEIQETDEFARGVLEKKKFNQWKSFVCSVNKHDDHPKLVFSSSGLSSNNNNTLTSSGSSNIISPTNSSSGSSSNNSNSNGSSSGSHGSARTSQTQSKSDVISCDLIAEIELCTTGKGAGEGRRFNIKLKSGQLISLRAKTFDTCSRWVTVLENLRTPEFMKSHEEMTPLRSISQTLLAKKNLGTQVSCVSEHLFSMNLTLTGNEAYRINPLVTVWVYDGEATAKDVSLSYPIVEVHSDQTGMCVAVAGLHRVELDESSIVFTSNPLSADEKEEPTSPSPNLLLSPRRRFVDEPNDFNEKKDSGVNDNFLLDTPPPPPATLTPAASDPPLTNFENTEFDFAEPFEEPPEPPNDKEALSLDDLPPPPPPSNPASRRTSLVTAASAVNDASISSAFVSNQFMQPSLSRRTSPVTPMDTPPSFPVADITEDVSDLSLSPRGLHASEFAESNSNNSNSNSSSRQVRISSRPVAPTRKAPPPPPPSASASASSRKSSLVNSSIITPTSMKRASWNTPNTPTNASSSSSSSTCSAAAASSAAFSSSEESFSPTQKRFSSSAAIPSSFSSTPKRQSFLQLGTSLIQNAISPRKRTQSDSPSLTIHSESSLANVTPSSITASSTTTNNNATISTPTTFAAYTPVTPTSTPLLFQQASIEGARTPERKISDGDLSLSGGFRRIVSHLTRGSMKKPGTSVLEDSDFDDFAEDGEASLIFDSSTKPALSSSEKQPLATNKKNQSSSAWVHLGSTELRDCPPALTREEKEKEGAGEANGSSARTLGNGMCTSSVNHSFRVLVPLYTALRPDSSLVIRDHPEQVVVNTANISQETLLRFSVFHVKNKEDPDSVNLKEAEELATCVTSLRALRASAQITPFDLKMFKPNVDASLQIQHFAPFTAEVSSCFGPIARKSFSFPSTFRLPQHVSDPTFTPLPPRPAAHERGSSLALPSLERSMSGLLGDFAGGGLVIEQNAATANTNVAAAAEDEDFTCVVHEKLTQSPFTFSVPALVLQESISAKSSLIRRLIEHIQVAKVHLSELKTLPEAMTAVVKAGVIIHPFVSHSKLVSGLEAYLKLLETSLRNQEQLLQMYLEPSVYLAQHSSCVTNPSLLGLPFRSSVAKKVVALRYIPTNLHLHTTVMRHLKSNDVSHEGGSTVYDITSVGASVDHVAGFKKGDIVTLQTAVQDMTQELTALDQAIEKATNKELQDLEEKRCVVELKLQQAETDLLSRKECVFAQSLAVLVSSFVSKLQACAFGSSLAHSPAVLTRIGAIGFLFQVESLLSTIYDEAHMLADYEYSVKQLQRVQFRLMRREDSESSNSYAQVESEDAPSYGLASQVKVRIQTPKDESDLLFAPLKLHIPTIRKSGYTSRSLAWKQDSIPPRKKKLAEPASKIVVILELPDELYSRLPSQLCGVVDTPVLTEGPASPRVAGPKLINVISVFFNQGVNEMQSLAISLGKVDQQKEINIAAKHILEAYANNFIAYCQRHTDAHSEYLIRAVKDGLEQLGPLLQGKQHKDILLLKVCNRLSRLMCSGTVVSCKSAKDRTSMSITWETAMALQELHGVRSRHTQGVMDLTRAHGVRRKNVLKNTRKKAYAFNAIQRRALPSALCPPDACCGKTQS